jgi:Putative zinc-finger
VENLRPRVRSAGSAHLPLDTLIDYYHGRLDPAAAETVQEHLALCPECAALVLDLESFAQAETAPPEDRTAARLLAQGITQQLRADRWRRTAAVAASLLLATVLPLGLYSLRAGRGAAVPATRGPTPEANLPIVSLYPRSSRRGAEVNRLDLPAGHRLVAVVLPTEEPPQAPDFALRVIGPSGREILLLRGLEPTSTGTFSVGLPASLLRPGRYQLWLTSVQRGRPITVEEYDLVVAGPGPGVAVPPASR